MGGAVVSWQGWSLGHLPPGRPGPLPGLCPQSRPGSAEGGRTVPTPAGRSLAHGVSGRLGPVAEAQVRTSGMNGGTDVAGTRASGPGEGSPAAAL